MAEVASAFVSLVPSARGFGSKLDSQVSGEVNGVARKTGLSFGKVFGAVAAIGIGAKAIDFLKGSLDEAREAQKVGAQTTAVIKSTGSAAGVTATQVGALAGALSAKTGIDDEVIQSGQNMLLTFKNIKNEAGAGNDIFNQTTKTLVDMSAAMGTEPKQAAIQLGKALNDPIKGISALSRVGVTFTDGQKKVIEGLVKGGKTAEAQKIILKELNSEFGGSAAAQATAGDKAAVAWGNLKEQIGTALLPVVDKVATVFTTKVVPAISTFVAQLQSGQGAGGKFASIAMTIASAIGTLFTFINENRAVATAFVGTIVAITVAQTAWNIALAANPIGLIVIAIAALVAGLVYAYQNFETFRVVVDAVFGFLKTVVTATVGFIADHWKLIITIIGGPLVAIGILVVKHWSAIKGFVTSAVSTVINFVKSHWRTIITIIGGPLGLAVALVTKHWNSIKSATTAVWNAVKSVVSSNVNAVKAIIGGIAALVGKVAGWFGQILSTIKTKLGEAVTFVRGVPGKMADALRAGVGVMVGIGRDLVQGLINGIKAMASSAADAAKAVVKGAIDGAKGILHIGSPSKVFHQIGEWTMEGFANGIKDAGPKVLKEMQSALEKTLDKVDSFGDRVASRLDGVKSAFSSLKDSIASTFTGNLFDVSAILPDGDTVGRSVTEVFRNGLQKTRSNLSNLLAAFKKLTGWGIPASFLSQLFASGNGALILEMASGSKNDAASSASLFGDIKSLSNQLGGAVARNQYGTQIDRLDKKLQRIEDHTSELKHLAKDIGRELNQAAAAAKRRADAK